MPAALPPTPWLKPAEPAEHFTRGYGLGLSSAREQASINQAQAHLQQQAVMAQMELDAKQQQQEKQNLLEKHKLEIEKQYRDAQLGIAKQKLDEESKLISAKTQRMAEQSAAAMRISQRVAAGEDYNQVMMEEGPSLFSGPALTSMIRAQNQATLPEGPLKTQPVLDPITQQPIPGAYSYPGASGRPQVRNTPAYKPTGYVSPAALIKIRSNSKRMESLQEKLDAYGPEGPVAESGKKRWAAMKAEFDKLQMENDRLLNSGGIETGAAVEAEAPAPKKATLRYIPGQGMVPIEEETSADEEEL